MPNPARVVEFMELTDVYILDSLFLLAAAVIAVMLEESLGFVAKGDWQLVRGSSPVPAGSKYPGNVWTGIDVNSISAIIPHHRLCRYAAFSLGTRLGMGESGSASADIGTGVGISVGVRLPSQYLRLPDGTEAHDQS